MSKTWAAFRIAFGMLRSNSSGADSPAPSDTARISRKGTPANSAARAFPRRGERAEPLADFAGAVGVRYPFVPARCRAEADGERRRVGLRRRAQRRQRAPAARESRLRLVRHSVLEIVFHSLCSRHCVAYRQRGVQAAGRSGAYDQIEVCDSLYEMERLDCELRLAATARRDSQARVFPENERGQTPNADARFRQAKPAQGVGERVELALDWDCG